MRRAMCVASGLLLWAVFGCGKEEVGALLASTPDAGVEAEDVGSGPALDAGLVITPAEDGAPVEASDAATGAEDRDADVEPGPSSPDAGAAAEPAVDAEVARDAESAPDATPDAGRSRDAQVLDAGRGPDAGPETSENETPIEPKSCQDQAIFSGVGYQTSCEDGWCDCRAGGLRWWCEDDGRSCRIARQNGVVTGACCDFAIQAPPEEDGSNEGGSCSASNRAFGERFSVECSDGDCTCRRNRRVVGTCEDPSNTCDLFQTEQAVHAGCCVFPI